MSKPVHVPAEVLEAWGFEDAEVELVRSGLINRTWRIALAGQKYALQWLNPIFGPESILDLEVLTTELSKAGVPNPGLHRCRNGDTFLKNNQEIWRCLRWIEGESFDSLKGAEYCREAGRVLGIFHAVFWDTEINLSGTRPPVHDLTRHRKHLETVLSAWHQHSNFESVRKLSERILRRPDPLPEIGTLPRRLVHGDPKISNILFDPRGRGICLIDLDTPSYSPLALELGDALRSWCHPGPEDLDIPFSVHLFQAALQGWTEGLGNHRPDRQEILAVIPGIESISLELAARFAADALEESYFAWDPSRYPSASAHNLARATAQYSLSCSVAARREELTTLLKRIPGCC